MALVALSCLTVRGKVATRMKMVKAIMVRPKLWNRTL
jgi:hypothetical protein